MPKSTTNKATANDARDPLAPKGELVCQIEMNTLRAMSMGELSSLSHSLNLLCDIFDGLLSQPRFQYDTHPTGPASILEKIYNFLSLYDAACVNVAAAAKPDHPDSIDARCWLMLRNEVKFTESLSNVCKVAAEGIFNIENAESNRHSAA